MNFRDKIQYLLEEDVPCRTRRLTNSLDSLSINTHFPAASYLRPVDKRRKVSILIPYLPTKVESFSPNPWVGFWLEDGAHGRGSDGLPIAGDGGGGGGGGGGVESDKGGGAA